MRTPFLYGEFELTIDLKNRLLVPSEIRKLIVPETDGDAFFVTLRNKVPWFYPERYFEHLARTQIRPDIAPNEDLLAFAHLNIALASRVDWDSQGRAVLPDRLLKRAGLDREVTLIGMQDHLELWDRTAWNIRRESLYEDSVNIEARAKAALVRQPADRPAEL